MNDDTRDEARFPPALPMFPELSATRWIWWYPQQAGPAQVDREKLKAPVRPRQRVLRYADWLSNRELAQGGVYIWLLPRPNNEGYRVVHVGMSRANMASRVRDHCYNQCRTSQHARNQYCAYDRIHRLEARDGDSFGTLGDALWEGGSGRSVRERAEAVEQFLLEARILFLSPAEGSASADQIKSMEAILGWASALLLTLKGPDQLLRRSDETTNTLPKLQATKFDDTNHLTLVAAFLNGIAIHAGIGQVLPNQPRVTA